MCMNNVALRNLCCLTLSKDKRGNSYLEIFTFAFNVQVQAQMCVHYMLSQLMPGNIVACKLEEVQLAELMIYHSHMHTT